MLAIAVHSYTHLEHEHLVVKSAVLRLQDAQEDVRDKDLDLRFQVLLQVNVVKIQIIRNSSGKQNYLRTSTTNYS